MCAHCLLSFHQIPLRQLSRFPWIFNLWTGWKDRLTGTSWRWAKRNAVSCTLGRNNQDTRGGQPAALWRRTWGLCRTLRWTRAPAVALPGLVRFRDRSLPSALRRPRPAWGVQRTAGTKEGLGICPEERLGELALLPAEGKARGCHKRRAVLT